MKTDNILKDVEDGAPSVLLFTLAWRNSVLECAKEEPGGFPKLVEVSGEPH